MKYQKDIIKPNPYKKHLDGKRIEDCDRQVLIDYHIFALEQAKQFGRKKGEDQRWFPTHDGQIRAISGTEETLAYHTGQISKLAAGLVLSQANFGWCLFSQP